MKKVIIFWFAVTGNIAAGQTNGNFESWDSTFGGACYSYELIDWFGIENPVGGDPSGWVPSNSPCGVVQTTDSHFGNYALLLHTWYLSAPGLIKYKDSISHQPTYLLGHYKYTVVSGGEALWGTMVLVLTRESGMATDTVATGTHTFVPADSYTPFQVELLYTSPLAPDSISIHFRNAENVSCDSSLTCNFLFLDDLTLSDTLLSIANHANGIKSIRIFPNPTNGAVSITGHHGANRCVLYNSLGQVLLDDKFDNGSIDLTPFSSGIYYYKLLLDHRDVKTGTIVRQ